MSKSGNEKIQLRSDQRESVIDHVSRKQEEILRDSSTLDDVSLYRVLVSIYNELTDQQKIEFILAGGFPLRPQYRPQSLRQKPNGRAGEDSSNTDTGGLPVLC